MELVIEFGQAGRAGYGSIHRKGCCDVRDPEPIGQHPRAGGQARRPDDIVGIQRRRGPG